MTNIEKIDFVENLDGEFVNFVTEMGIYYQ